jgi:hypothetical protein
VYSCPSPLPTGAHIVGRGAIVPPELMDFTNFALIKVVSMVPVVRVLCDHDFTIKDAKRHQLAGLLFDFRIAVG